MSWYATIRRHNTDYRSMQYRLDSGLVSGRSGICMGYDIHIKIMSYGYIFYFHWPVYCLVNRLFRYVRTYFPRIIHMVLLRFVLSRVNFYWIIELRCHIHPYPSHSFWRWYDCSSACKVTMKDIGRIDRYPTTIKHNLVQTVSTILKTYCSKAPHCWFTVQPSRRALRTEGQ